MSQQPVNQFQPKGRVKVVKGSILTPENAGLRFVLSVNNLGGKPEGNPLLPIFNRKWPKVQQESRGWYATKTGAYKLGAVQTTAVQSDVWVVHMLCQGEDLSVNAEGLQKCLKQVCKDAKYERATVHVSTVLTNSIPELTNLLQSELIDQGVAVSFYEEPEVK
jgi:hypothetical protein